MIHKIEIYEGFIILCRVFFLLTRSRREGILSPASRDEKKGKMIDSLLNNGINARARGGERL